MLLPGCGDDPKLAQLLSRVAIIWAVSKNFHEKPYSRPDLANPRQCQRHTDYLLEQNMGRFQQQELMNEGLSCSSVLDKDIINQGRNGLPLTFKWGHITIKIVLGKIVQSPDETTHESHCYIFIHMLLQACCPSRLWEEKGKKQNRKS